MFSLNIDLLAEGCSRCSSIFTVNISLYTDIHSERPSCSTISLCIDIHAKRPSHWTPMTQPSFLNDDAIYIPKPLINLQSDQSINLPEHRHNPYSWTLSNNAIHIPEPRRNPYSPTVNRSTIPLINQSSRTRHNPYPWTVNHSTIQLINHSKQRYNPHPRTTTQFSFWTTTQSISLNNDAIHDSISLNRLSIHRSINRSS